MQGKLRSGLPPGAAGERSGGAGPSMVRRLKVARPPRILRKVFITLSVTALTLCVVPGAMVFDLPGERVVSTQVGEQKTITLTAGLDVTLNASTTVYLASRAEEQRVRVARGGEVLVKTASGVAKRVRVAAGPIAVETTTSAAFTVRHQADGTCHIRVMQGTATLLAVRYDEGEASAAFAPMSLPAGRQAVLRRGQLFLSSFSDEEAAQSVAWASGYLVFRNESLGDAVVEFNRYNYQQLVIIDRSIAKVRIIGQYRATDVTAFVRDLRHLAQIKTVSYRAGGRRGSVILLMSPDPSGA